MRALLQRVTSAAVRVDRQVVGSIDREGLLIFLGVTRGDTAELAGRLASKIWTLRILAGEKSCAQQAAPVLVVSQFTLYADTRKGRRPSWNAAAPREISEPIIDAFVEHLRNLGAEVETGRFGAIMDVSLVNSGPVTLILDSADLHGERR
ncbi:MAG TPA: D-aminoacyl-tRNA deacylase [Microlunatus sp.]